MTAITLSTKVEYVPEIPVCCSVGRTSSVPSGYSGSRIAEEEGTILAHDRSIAVIDDDAMVRSGMATLLRSYGLDARTYASADEFLDFGESDFDCLISDVQMPGSSGLQLQKILAERGSSPPLILMTAFPDERIRQQALLAGALDFLEKPVDGRQLLVCLERALGELS